MDGIFLSVEQFPPHYILESLYKSWNLKTLLELYNFEIHQKKAKRDYHRLKTIMISLFCVYQNVSILVDAQCLSHPFLSPSFGMRGLEIRSATDNAEVAVHFSHTLHQFSLCAFTDNWPCTLFGLSD